MLVRVGVLHLLRPVHDLPPSTGVEWRPAPNALGGGYLSMITVHGHFVDSRTVLYVGVLKRDRKLLVVYRGNASLYAYNLGDSWKPGVCCLIAKQPSVGSAIAKLVKARFPFEILKR